ncbi:heterokaryon incompatibility protein-domain-containing protein [Neurospora tetraspora]|uniref:Heterokaryon incompatibility protein-domain-containing protein n=1 Tax=Neurospora tetraspora TaxID=94610 RepID=A0AAE0JHI6_9PEZI|nr:heterokaryon incompatibility protein-domain-containing protein [Neurospora tetraspora]
MSDKQTQASHVPDGEGRLSSHSAACWQLVAKIPFFRQVDQEQEEDGNSLNLCQRCKEIDLNGIFNDTSVFFDSETVLFLGILDKESTCALCRLFYSMRRTAPDGKPTDSYNLRKYCFGEFFDAEECTLWAVDPAKSSLLQLGKFSAKPTLLDMRHSWFIPHSPSSDFNQPMRPWPNKRAVKGLPVKETSVNYPLLRCWIKECEDDHPGCSLRSSEPTKSHTGPTIRGIDCRTRKIVELQPGDQYIALSYVWGNKPFLENKGNRALPTNAPKVIEDAMIVVRELGQRYLWVDQYCIDQHDEQAKHAQIRNMAHIYEGSYATIVAFSGENSSCGLPGVSSTPRIPQPRFTSSRLTLLGFTPVLTRQSFEASIWSKRGWTFQEALLSRRLLIFAPEQVYFHCPSGIWAENSTPAPRLDVSSYIDHQSADWKREMRSIFPLTRVHDSTYGFQVETFDIQDLLPLIEGYGRRQLSFQADALDAFRGLLSRVSIVTYWGIPAYDLPQSHRGSFVLDGSEADALFLQCLFWIPLHTATRTQYLGRREGFPSWSWLGWRTPVTFAWHYPKYDIDAMMLPTVKVEDENGALLSLVDVIESSGTEMERSRALPERTTYLWLEGLVLTLGFQRGSRRDGRPFRFCLNHPLGYSDPPCEMRDSCKQRTYASGGLLARHNQIEFRLEAMGPIEIYERILERTWDCILLFTRDPSELYFLILDEGDDAAYCVGTLCVGDSSGDLIEKLKTKEG